MAGIVLFIPFIDKVIIDMALFYHNSIIMSIDTTIFIISSKITIFLFISSILCATIMLLRIDVNEPNVNHSLKYIFRIQIKQKKFSNKFFYLSKYLQCKLFGYYEMRYIYDI